MRRLPSILALLTAAAMGAACRDAAAPGVNAADVPEQSAFTPADTGSPQASFPGTVWGYGAAGADSAAGLGRVAGVTVQALAGSPEREVARVVSGADGMFAFDPLPDGTYRFVATPPAGSPHGPGELHDIVVRDGRMGTVYALNIILDRR